MMNPNPCHHMTHLPPHSPITSIQKKSNWTATTKNMVSIMYTMWTILKPANNLRWTPIRMTPLSKQLKSWFLFSPHLNMKIFNNHPDKKNTGVATLQSSEIIHVTVWQPEFQIKKRPIVDWEEFLWVKTNGSLSQEYWYSRYNFLSYEIPGVC